MGLIKKLRKQAKKVAQTAESVGSKAYTAGIRPTYEEAARPAGKFTFKRALRGVSEAARSEAPFTPFGGVVGALGGPNLSPGISINSFLNGDLSRPGAVAIKLGKDDPRLIIPEGLPGAYTREERGRELAKRGLPLDFFHKGFLEASKRHTGKKPVQEALESELAELPLWQRIPLEIAGDPATYALLPLGAGAVSERVGVEGGTKALSIALGRELLEQTGAPALMRLPTAPLGIWRGTQTARLARAKSAAGVLASSLEDANSAKSLALGAARREEELTKVKDLRAAIDAELAGDTTSVGLKARIRATLNFPDANTLEKKYIDLAHSQRALAGDTVERADIVKELRAHRATNLTGARVSLLDEQLQGLKAHAAESQLPRSPQVKLTRRLPGVKQLFDLVAPITLEDDPARLLFHSRDTKLAEIQDNLNLMRGHLNTRARHAGLVADPQTRLVKGIQSTKGMEATIDNILRFPERFTLTPQQLDVVNAFHVGRRGVSATIKGFLEATPGLNKEVRAWVQKLGQASAEGGDFVPRVPFAVAPDAAAMAKYRSARPSLAGRVARRVGRTAGAVLAPGQDVVRVPKGFEQVTSVRRGLGAKQATEYDRVLAEAQDADRVLFAHQVGDIFAGYAGQVTQIAADDGVILPMLKKMGIKPEELISKELDETVARSVRAKGKIGKARVILNAIGRGDRVSRRTLVTLKSYAADADLPEEMRVGIDNVTGHADRYITSEELSQAGAKAVSQEAAGAGGRAAAGIKGAQARRQGKQAEEVAATVTGATSQLPVEEYERLAEGIIDVSPVEYNRAVRQMLQRIDDPEGFAKVFPAEAAVHDYMARTGKTIEQLFAETRERGAILPPPDFSAVPGPEATTIFEDTAAARKAMRTAARDTHTASEPAWVNADTTIKDARRARMNAKKAATVFDLRQSQIPGLSGTWFDKAIAKNIDEAYGIGTRDRGSAVRTAASFNIMQQALQAGGDISATFLQSLAVLPSNPFGWAKALGYSLVSMVNPDVYYKYLENLSNVYDPATGRWKSVV